MATKTSTSPSSSSSCSSRKSNHIHFITESEMEAAHHLMELSDEENNSNNNNNNIASSFMKRKRTRTWDYIEEEEGVKQRVCNDDIIIAKIQEIFGNDFEVFQPKKQRRYRSLVNIYMTTRPLNAGNGTRVRA
ncbi:hypothetical protein Lal_00024017 [Lupinus albus]|uniref:Uncharacterized protein n=1 Tax=Lupinus albus TaxID=3870 RepID=A0A6A4PIW8_LUPAL|nr:hypothetical protein Lalb_Chr13g0296371 [Lupinus albus]KAF1888006.1 hypothetical protein Lal_00024017 [Lupinus albus]